ncbi:MAG TPA: hypothetical protein VEB19_17910 [Gemmatimonadaceae bacterium]|nr:hypothetical protein [Gemmatimonadaceae bacterium]
MTMHRWIAGAALAFAAACASTQAGSPSTDNASAQPTRIWPVITRNHVDLWLHGYAMLLRDTATVPVFRRGYRDRVQSVKSQRGISTLLDANRERLQSRLAISPALVNGQFAPLYFASFEQMRQVIDLFLRADGNPNATNDAVLRQFFAVLASSYGSAADRDWLRLFVESVEDERRKFYQEYWATENGGRMGYVRAADSIWQNTYLPKLRRFLNNTQQENGEIVLALTIGGEGRTVNFTARQNAVASTMPDSDPAEAIYVFAHEIVNAIVSTAVNDNTTPNDQRAGVAGRYITTGTVRAGAMLLARAAPELLAGYTRYYLSQAGQSTTGDINARLASTFPLPTNIVQAIERQLEVVLGGI